VCPRDRQVAGVLLASRGDGREAQAGRRVGFSPPRLRLMAVGGLKPTLRTTAHVRPRARVDAPATPRSSRQAVRYAPAARATPQAPAEHRLAHRSAARSPARTWPGARSPRPRSRGGRHACAAVPARAAQSPCAGRPGNRSGCGWRRSLRGFRRRRRLRHAARCAAGHLRDTASADVRSCSAHRRPSRWRAWRCWAAARSRHR